jgi:hypothetical protein
MPRGIYQRRPLLERFWEKVNKNGPLPSNYALGRCWIWTGAKTPYGAFSTGRCQIGAHVFSYEITYRTPVPAGLELDHLCRNPTCVNPVHLEAVTAGENVRRGISLAARNARKTHCPKGHPLRGRNILLVRPRKSAEKTGRACRTCTVQRTRDYRAALRGALSERSKRNLNL